MEKHKFKIDLFELLRLHVPTNIDEEIARRDKAAFYLVFDKCFQLLVTGSLRHWGLDAIDGKVQAMYFWFYRKSYGYGYSACPMGQLELAHKLKWSRDRVKRHLTTLIKKGHITPLDRYKMFNNYRPQVFEVAFPRILLQRKIDQIKDEANREYIRREVAKFLGKDEASA